MLILPVGLEKNEVRRIPWVSATLIAACVLIHLVLSVSTAGTERETSERLEEAFRYLAQRPYLSVPTDLEEMLTDEGWSYLEEGREAFLDDPRPGDVVNEEQGQLEELTREAMATMRRLPGFRFGFIPAEPRAYAFLTHAFLHAGWLHLLGNMLFLFLSGPFVEDLYGRPLFTGLYLAAAVAGAAAFAAGAPDSTAPLVGASGAIAGVMGAFLWRLARRRIHFLLIPIILVPTWNFRVVLPAFVVLPLWALQQLYYASTAGADSPVAFSAHVGGFLFGLAFALVVHLLKIEETIVAPAIEKETTLRQHPGLERASEARLAGDFPTARREVALVLREEPENLDGWLESWELALDSEDGEAAGRAGGRLLELLRRRGERELLWNLMNDPRWRSLPMPARFLLSAADHHVREGDGRSAIDLFQRASAGGAADDLSTLRAIVGEGEILARAGDTRAAEKVFERARAHPGCSEPWIERMDAALRVPPRDPGGPPRRG